MRLLKRYGLVLCIIALYFALYPSVLWQPGSLALLLRQTALLGICTLGAAVVATPCGYMLGAGAQVVLYSILFSRLAEGFPALLCLLACACAALLLALATYASTHFVGIPLLVFSFALEPILTGLNAQMAPLLPGTGGGPGTFWLQPWLWGLPPVLYLAVGLCCLVALYYRYTTWGCAAIAVGENPAAAGVSGLKTGPVKLFALCAGFLLLCIGGVFASIWQNGAVASYHSSVRSTDILCALCLASVPIRGGRARMPGVLLGSFAMVLLNSLAVRFAAGRWDVNIAKGFIIVLSLLLQLHQQGGIGKNRQKIRVEIIRPANKPENPPP